MAQDDNVNFTKFVMPGGALTAGHGLAGDMLTLSSPSGSNIQWTDEVKSEFNSGKSQSLTLGDNFITNKGNSSEFTAQTKEIRVTGDHVEIIGPDIFLQEDIQSEWYKEYQKGWGTYKEQFNDNRNSLPNENFKINSLYNIPTGASSIVVSPPLIDGTAEDNLNVENKTNFMKKFEPNIQVNADFQQKLNETYNNPVDNVKSVRNSMSYIA